VNGGFHYEFKCAERQPAKMVFVSDDHGSRFHIQQLRGEAEVPNNRKCCHVSVQGAERRGAEMVFVIPVQGETNVIGYAPSAWTSKGFSVHYHICCGDKNGVSGFGSCAQFTSVGRLLLVLSHDLSHARRVVPRIQDDIRSRSPPEQ
jgi:hypothetical protein